MLPHVCNPAQSYRSVSGVRPHVYGGVTSDACVLTPALRLNVIEEALDLM